jgi:hypothetical protein
MRTTVAIGSGIALAAAACLVGGCGVLPLPGQRPCTLEVATDTRDGLTPLAAPYVVDLPRPGTGDHLAVSLSGSGFQDARLVVIGPTGFMEEDSPGLEAYLNGTSVAFDVDRPGPWRVHLQDDVAGCTFEFTVEAQPPA